MELSKNVQLVNEYIAAYNSFDLDLMLSNLADEIVFKNIVDGQANLSILGKSGFKEQALQAMAVFSERNLSVLDTKEDSNTVEVSIHYSGVLRIDIPQGGRKGDQVEIDGKSIFDIYEGKIYSIQDIS